MRSFHRIALGTAVVVVSSAVTGFARIHAFSDSIRHPVPVTYTQADSLARVPLDPTKKTIAILLGDITEITDALGPYEVFARARVFNVVTVAVDRRPTRLTGGLAVVPDISLNELASSLGGRAPDVVVVPHIPNIAQRVNQPLVESMRAWAAAGATMLSWCTGAGALAESGVLNGRRATAHWGDLSRLERRYPDVAWQRGVRWVDDGSVVSSAGLTSGIDATLRVVRRLTGEATAQRIARELRYPNYRYSIDANAEQYTARLADAVFLANIALRPGRARIGVALFDGVSELDLSNVYDTYFGSGAAVIVSVGASASAVRTAHGMWLIPDLSASTGSLERLDRVLLTGTSPDARAQLLIARARTSAPRLAITAVQRGDDRYGLEPVLEDLARTSDVSSAVFAQRRLEYRSDSMIFEGPMLPWTVFVLPLFLAAAVSFNAFASRIPRHLRLGIVALSLVVVTPFLARAQASTIPAGTRVRLDLYSADRDLLGRPRTQSIAGTLAGEQNDSWLLTVRDGADTIRVPATSVSHVLVSHGRPARWASALQSAITSSLISGTLNALVLTIRRRDGNPSPWEGFVDAAKSTAPFTAAVGFLLPLERWRRP